jgi:CheY-like chemotaxis protein
LQRLLEINGYNCATVQNGREALRYLPGSQIELVITDILMPEVDGYELIPKLRKTVPGVRILAMTGNAPQFSFDMHRTARMLGADRVIGKPFELTEIIRVVKELLAKTEAASAATSAGKG